MQNHSLCFSFDYKTSWIYSLLNVSPVTNEIKKNKTHTHTRKAKQKGEYSVSFLQLYIHVFKKLFKTISIGFGGLEGTQLIATLHHHRST